MTGRTIDIAPADAAHRALVEAHVLGLVPRVKRGLRIVVGELAALAHSEVNAIDLVVATDEGATDDEALAAHLAAVARLAASSVLALIVASPITRALAHGSPGGAATGDAWADARRWATTHQGGLAPALDPSRLARIVALAEAHGLVLVEADLATVAPPFAHVRAMRSPRARALFATIAMGAGARPLFFVPAARAPKAGLARAKVERLTDAWIGVASGDADLAAADDADKTDETDETHDLAHAAREVLTEAATAHRAPLSFKELLREAREQWTANARARGARATPSSRDARDLALWLHRSAAAETVRLHALDPADPGWELVVVTGAAGAI